MTSNASRFAPSAPAAWEPVDVAEVAECLISARHQHRTVNVTGGGTAAMWGGGCQATATLRTHKLDSVLRYEPSDMTIQVGSGMPVTELQSVTAEHGQRLALDAARISRGATIGGIFATADQGPAQLAFGGPRDLVIGATLVLANGEIAHSGGHVIKNVAGYDLARLVSGSLGTLAVITDLTFRLHPLPAATGTLSFDTGIGEAVAYAEAISAAALDPIAAEWTSGRLLVRFEGTDFGVQERLRVAAELVGAGKHSILDADESDEAWADHADASTSTDTALTTILRGLVRPTDVFSVVQAFHRIVHEHDPLPTVAAGLLTGRIDAKVSGSTLSTHAEVVGQWRAAVEAAGGTLTMRERPEGLTDLVDAWGTAPSAAAVMRAVKSAYDPADLLGPGRFHPWF